jgi:DNA-binding NarL/FixJ family response regulator
MVIRAARVRRESPSRLHIESTRSKVNSSPALEGGSIPLNVTGVSRRQSLARYSRDACAVTAGTETPHLRRYQLQRSEKDLGIDPTSVAPAVLVAQAEPELRRRFAAVLKQAFPSGSVILSDRVDESLVFLDTRLIDIAVIGPDLLDGSGHHLVQRCLRSSPLTRCVITTPGDDDACLVQALAAGALGCLLENHPEAVLIKQLRLLAQGIPPLAPPIAGRLLRHFASRPTRSTRANIELDTYGDLVHLSEKEQQVLRLIAERVHIGEVARLLEMSTDDVCGCVKDIYLKRAQASRAAAALEFRYRGVA